ncbi:MAG: hypothetical protein LUH02_11790 [Erysipelotrichaceae bacterium]|nr:hypothetical protein [Erysipelotrichaceae bacterium]
MSYKPVWYINGGRDCLEGDEAVEYLRNLLDDVLKLREKILQVLDLSVRNINHYQIKEGNDFETMYENYSEICDICGWVGIELEMLLNDDINPVIWPDVYDELLGADDIRQSNEYECTKKDMLYDMADDEDDN